MPAKNQEAYNKIVAENFKKFKYFSLIFFVYTVIILISDFAPVEIWNQKYIYSYRILDASMVIVTATFTLFFWFYKKGDSKTRDIASKSIVFSCMVWAGLVAGVEFSAVSNSALVIITLICIFFVHFKLVSITLMLSSAMLAVVVSVYYHNPIIENINAILFTYLISVIISVLISWRNYSTKLKEIAKSIETQKLNKQLRKAKKEQEELNEELWHTNSKLIAKREELEETLMKLHETQVQLVHSEKMAALGTLTAGIAHEINNPVNFIKSSITGLNSNLDFLSENLKNNKQNNGVSNDQIIAMLKKSIEIIDKGVQRTTKIVEGLKTFVKPGEDSVVVCDLNANIDNTLLLMQNQIGEHIKITKHYGQIGWIKCTPSHINQVLMNILRNAIDAIEEKGEITIKTEKTNQGKIRIEIADTGVGIASEIKNKIFDPFFTTKDVGKGTGLGLSISYRIIKDHQGDILVESEPGKGSSFAIEVPLEESV